MPYNETRGSARVTQGCPGYRTNPLRVAARGISLFRPRTGDTGNHRPPAGKDSVRTEQVNVPAHTTHATADWHVLVLYADDTERDIKGIWGPYTTVDIATDALDELRQWPLDGFWDMRRLNKFVAAKAGNAPNQLRQWTWNNQARD